MGEQHSVSVSGGGCFGCLGTIAFFMVVWALIFGVTIGGVHHSLSCSKDKGVAIRQVAEEDAKAPAQPDMSPNATDFESSGPGDIAPGDTVIYEKAPPRYEHVPEPESSDVTPVASPGVLVTP